MLTRSITWASRDVGLELIQANIGTLGATCMLCRA